MGKRLEIALEWFTPRRRFWVGVGLLAITMVVPMIRPGTNMTFLVAPAVICLLSAFILPPHDKR